MDIKKTLCIILLGLFLINLAYALEFDNFKYERDTTFDGKQVFGNQLLEKYKPIEIKNAFGFGRTLFEGYLSQHTETCGIKCSSTIEINLHEDGVLINDIIFKTKQKDNSWIKQDVRSYKFTYRGEIDDFETPCNIIGQSKNGTDIKECNTIKTGSHEGWVNYNVGEKLNAGVYTLKLNANKKPSRKVDWVIKTNGETLNSWAVWGNISEGDDAEVILNSPVNGSTTYTNKVQFNATAEVTGGATLINMSLWTNETGSWELRNTTDYGNSIGESRNIAPSGTESVTNKRGLRLIPKANITVTRVTKFDTTTATTAYILDSSKSILATASFVGHNATFNYELIDGVTYFVGADSGGSAYTSSIKFGGTTYPIDGININWTGNFRGSTNDTEVDNIQSLDYNMGVKFETEIWNRTIIDGIIWNVQACDSDGDCGFATSNYSLFLDTIAPTFIIETPTEIMGYGKVGENETLNITFTDTNLESCWYNYNGTNISIEGCVSGVKNSTSFILEEGNTNMTIYANDSIGQLNSTVIEWSYKVLENSRNYTTPTYQTSLENYIINITSSSVSAVELIINNTGYTMTNNGGGIFNYEMGITEDMTGNNSIEFNFTYSAETIQSYTSYQQVESLEAIVLNKTCNDKSLKFEILDENNATNLFGEVNYNIKYGLGSGTYKTIYGLLSNVSSFYLCVNGSINQNYTIGYGEFQYKVNSYTDRRYYLFEGQTISNNTLTNYTLRDLLSADQTSFLLTMEDTSLNVYVGKYTALWRWYPELNEYQIVEMGKTDDDGETVAHVETEDVDYRIGLYETDGTLIALDNPRRFVCTSSPCSLTIRVGAGDVDYSSVFDVQSEITYNKTTGIFLVVYNDPTQLTSEMRFLVTRSSGTNTLIICNETSSGFSGAMSCDTSAYTGLKKAVLYRSASPELPIAQKVVSEANTTFNSGFGLFISVMLWLVIVLSGFSSSPIPLLVLSVVGLIPALLMGAINIAIFTGIATLGAIIIHFIKRAVAK